MYNETIGKMRDIFLRKNNDYHNSAHRTYCRFGPTALIVRISDKFERIEALQYHIAQQEVHGEQIEDTMLDAANYLIMLAGELWWEKKLTRKILLSDQEDTTNVALTLQFYDAIAEENDEDIIEPQSLQIALDDIHKASMSDKNSAVDQCIELAMWLIRTYNKFAKGGNPKI